MIHNVEKDENGKVILKEIVNKCDGSLTRIKYNSDGKKMIESKIRDSTILSTKIFNEEGQLVGENKTFEHLKSGVIVASRRDGTVGYITIGRTDSDDSLASRFSHIINN